MSKNIVILCDGTSNQIGGDRTNVLRLYGSIVRDDTQVVFYDPGVGTFGEIGAEESLRSRLKITKGLIFGHGIDDNVMDAYRFLVSYYKKGDRIFIFGFSRGAYTARMTAGFMKTLGLLKPEQMTLLEYAYRAYKRVTERDADDKVGSEIDHYRKVLQAPCPSIEFLGVWDTVGSIREPKPSGWGGMWSSHIHVDDNDRIKTVRHAVAIDERRTMFRPSLWEGGQRFVPDPLEDADETATNQDFKEVWFAGCHRDVGGGEPEGKSGLAKIPLQWMLREAQKCGININEESYEKVVRGQGKYTKPDPLAAINDSMKNIYRWMEYLPRQHNALSTRPPQFGSYYLPLQEMRRIPEGALIHQSVVTRMKGNPLGGPYCPKNLPKTFQIEPENGNADLQVLRAS